MKLMKFSKRAFALVLAATMAFSNSFVVSAATPTKATDLSGAYDGTPSKVIGLETDTSYSVFNDASGSVAATYQNNNLYYVNRSAVVKGKPEAYKDAATGLYLFNGVYYCYYDTTCWNGAEDTHVYFYSPVIFGEPVMDPNTGMYVLNGVSYAWSYTADDGRKYVVVSEEAVVAGAYANKDALDLACGVKYNTDSKSVAHYTVNGRSFKDYWPDSKYVNGQKVYFFTVGDEIFLNASGVSLDWNYLTSHDKYVTADNKLINVGYQLEVNGASYDVYDRITEEGDYVITDSDYDFGERIILKAGESVSFRVRGVYYTSTESVNAEGKKVYTYNTYKKGAWSEPCTFKYNGLRVVELPALTVTAAQDDDIIKVDWNANEKINTYRVEYVRSSVPLNITSENWNKYYGTYNSSEWDAVEAANPDLIRDYEVTTTSKTRKDIEWYSSTPYYYFMVRADRWSESIKSEYDMIKMPNSNIAAIQIVPQGINTPALSNFKVIKKASDVGITLSWTPVDANVVIYRCEKKTFPALYNYGLLDAYAMVANADGTTSMVELADKMDSVSKRIISEEVHAYTVNGMNGECTVYPEAGKKYYFIAHTYDYKDSNIAKSTPIATIDGINFNYYTAFGPATKKVSAKAELYEPSVVTSATKTSIKISITGYDYETTGFEIYRKSGKKWKKLTTTIDNHYIDEDLKANTKYSYKIRAFYYNTDSKVKAYSDYKYFTATTGTADGILLTATKKSTKSVKLTWTKVANATKYEIYRSNESSGDPSKLYEKFSSGNWKGYLASEKYELIKTINKASTTSYTNSGLAAGEDYSYIIMAYYKSGKKTAYISDYAGVSMEIGTPQDVATVNTGSKVKVTWTKDPYAKKYEVRYTVYDSEGFAKNDMFTEKTTTKNSFTISGIQSGGYAAVSVRAIGKNGKYSDWSEVEQGKSLAGAKSVKATNVMKTLASGKKVAAVKISWKKVSGAKYYRVYRTTKKPVYYADTKMYRALGSYIAKEANDDEGNYDYEYYEELNGVEGSIVKTSAVDYAQLDVGVDYYYTVVAYGPTNTAIRSYASYDNANQVEGSGSYSKITFNNKVTVTAKVAKKKVTLSWNKIPGVTKYVVYRATSKKGKYTKIATTKKASYTDKKVKKGKTYYYKIEAVGTNIFKNKFEITSNIKKVKAK